MRKVIALSTLALLVAAGAQAELQMQTFTATPGITIPDAPGGPVTSNLEIDLDHYISDIRIYIDITTPVGWSSDLVLEMTSAWGTTVRLCQAGECGWPATSPVGWYPTDFTPFEDWSEWIGEGAGGIWSIMVQDVSTDGGDSMLNEFRIEVHYDDAIATDAATWSSLKALYE